MKELYVADIEKIKPTYSKSYYEMIICSFNPDKISGVLTTIYFRYPELTEVSKENIVYLNGSLNMLYLPETLEVIDITKENLPEDKLFFPFIFGQSYVKPIIHHHQIEQFEKMNTILTNSNCLVI